MNEPSPMVELRGVSKSFGSTPVLHSVDLQIRAGEFITFLGPSGCGKTTCLRLIGGFENPTEGRVFLDGRDVTDDPPYRRDVNQVFQSYALFPHLNVFDNIAFGLKIKKLPPETIREKVGRALDLVSMNGFGPRRPSELSGGQRQRVALARALVCEPRVLLLDEPLSALDAKLRDQMRAELKVLQKKLGITFVFVTHDQEEALSMSDRIAVMNEGRVEQVGTAADIYHRPSTRFVATFIGDTNIVEANVLGERDGFLLCELEGGLRLEVTPGNGALPNGSILVSLRPEKIRIFAEPPPGPQNVFESVIESEVFKGAVDDLTLRTVGDLELGVLDTNEGGDEIEFEVGSKVFCRIHPDDIVILNS